MRSRDETYLYRRDTPGSTRIGQYCRQSIQDQWEGWQAAEAAALNRAAQIAEEMVLYTGLDVAQAIRDLDAPLCPMSNRTCPVHCTEQCGACGTSLRPIRKLAEIAEIFGVCRSAISNISSGRSWK